MEVLEPTPVKKMGVLKKLGGGGGGHKNWKDRFFVLAKHLAYYSSQKAYEKEPNKPLGVISLNSYFCSKTEGTNFEFAVNAYPKSLVCRAHSAGEMEEWIDALLAPLSVGDDAPYKAGASSAPTAGAGAGSEPAA